MYVPSQYDLKEPAALMIFQDGFAYVDELGDFRVPIVYDNLIYKKSFLLQFAICKSRHNSIEYPEPRWESNNRCLEYDVLNDKYVTILIDEIIPEVKKKYNISDERNYMVLVVCLL